MKTSTFSLKQFQKNERDNDHTTNALLLAKEFGTESEIFRIEQIKELHQKQGFLTVEQTRERHELTNKYYKLLK